MHKKNLKIVIIYVKNGVDMKTKKFIGILLGIFFAAAGVLLFKMDWFLALVITVGGIVLLVKSLMNLMDDTEESETVEENEMRQDMQTERESNKVKLRKTDYTNYNEDSLLLLSQLKDKIGGSKTQILIDEERSKLEEKLSDAIHNVFINRLFQDDICVYQGDDGTYPPDGNWIQLKENVNLIDAVKLYLELKYYVQTYKDIESIHAFSTWEPYRIWLSSITFFISEDEIDLSDKEKEELLNLCQPNNIHIVSHTEKFEFVDIFDFTKYILNWNEVPCGVDLSGTKIFYHLVKIDSEVKTDKEKLSDKILNGILHSYCDKKYYYDISLNQINIKISLDKERFYFLTVYVNASTGLINKFSFDMEEAADTHYEFDLSGAEKLRGMCIARLPDVNRYYDKSLDNLMKEYLSKCDGLLLESLVGSISTAVFHFD